MLPLIQSSCAKTGLGTAAISFLVISAAAPLTGIAGAFPIAILQGNGSGLPFDFVLITILLLIFAVGYCRMASRITNAGSFFALVSEGLGGLAGSSAALICLLAYNGLQIGLYGLFGAATAGTVASLTGFELPWYLWSLAAAGLIGLMGFRRIEFSARLLTVLVVVRVSGGTDTGWSDSGSRRRSGSRPVEFQPCRPGSGRSSDQHGGLFFVLHGVRGSDDLQRRGQTPKPNRQASNPGIHPF